MKHLSHTKRFVCLFLLLCLIPLTACNQGDTSASSSSTEDAGISPIIPSRDVYFRETHALNTSHSCVLYDVAVKKVLQWTYNPSFTEQYLLIECEIKHIFYQTDVTRTPFATEGDTILLWVNMYGYERDTADSFRTYLESVESAIVYGNQTEPHILKDSPLCSRLKQELDEDSISYANRKDGSQVLALPNVEVHDLKSWQIIPILDGKFDAGGIMSALGVDHMAFSFASEIPEGWQYFKDGDDVDTVYNALDRFVSEFEAL